MTVCMVPQVKSESATQAPLKKDSSRFEGRHLTARWMVLVGSLILAWVSLVPLIWIGSLLFSKSLNTQGMIVCGGGLFVFAVNLFCLKTYLSELYHEGAQKASNAPTRRQLALFFGLQILAAYVCTSASGRLNPIGMQQWFWMPIVGFGGLLLRRRRQMVLLLLLTLLVSTLQQLIKHGPSTAIFWMFGQISTSVFIISCSFAMAQASRQRLKTAQMADELSAANAKLELQADQASVLAVAQERNRLAREIHDAVGHSLTVVGVQLDAAEALLQQAPERALDSIQKAQRSSREGLAEIRRSVSSLRATPQEQRTLAESLTSLITGAERPGLKLTLQQSGKSRPLPSLVEISLYRCAQEGITNACRHAGASEITVHLDFTSNTSVGLSVTDNGRGFSESSEKGHGLKGLRERTALLNGEFFAGTAQQGGGYCRMVVPA